MARAYYTNGSTVFSFDTEPLANVQLLSRCSAKCLAVDASDNTKVYAGLLNKVIRLDSATGTHVLVSTMNGALDMSVDSTGKVLVATGYGIWEIDPTQDARTNFTKLSDYPAKRVSIRASDNRFYATDGSPDIAEINRSTGAVTRRVEDPPLTLGIADVAFFSGNFAPYADRAEFGAVDISAGSIFAKGPNPRVIGAATIDGSFFSFSYGASVSEKGDISQMNFAFAKVDTIFLARVMDMSGPE